MNVLRLLAGICIAMALPSGPAQAVNLGANGRGQALLFPYYTVNRNLDTYVSISNPSPNFTVAKVRFLEGHNGRPVADFNLYLAPHDMWTAAITRTADGSAPMLKTADHSCTTPAIPAEGLVFSTYGFDGSGALPADDGPQDISRTREGSIEVITGGDFLASSPTALAIAPASDGGPPSCTNLAGALFADVVPPSNNLYGSAAIIDVGAGQYYAYTADAIANLTIKPLFAATNGPLEPSLAQANSSYDPSDVVVAYVFADNSSYSAAGIPLAYEFANGIDAVTALFMVDTLSNEYELEASLGASTDWVLLNPTQRFYVDPVYAINAPSGAFAMRRNGVAAVYDREGVDALPADQEGIPLPYNHINVIGFQSPSATPLTASDVLGSQLMTKIVTPTAQAGVMRLDIGYHHSDIVGRADGFPALVDVHAGYQLFGSSFTGFMVSNVVNSNAQPGRLANYGSASHHRATACSGIFLKPILCGR